MKKGDSGDEVTELQTALKMLGCDLVVDGAFGKDTDREVRRFQRRSGLKVDGVVGPVTEAAIVAALQAAKVVPGAEVMPTGKPTVVQSAPDTASDTLSVVVRNAPGTFDGEGRYSGARQCPAHPNRIGGEIALRGAVVHTTDMRPGSMPALVRAWMTKGGEGNAATFLIGRQPAVEGEEWPTGGVVQFAPVDRNTNHAGGPNGSHGWILTPDGKRVHPNSAYAGIELDGAGRLEKLVTKYGHPSSGEVIEPADVFLDERGKPWHKITDYQFEQLGLLLDAILANSAPWPAGTAVQSNGSYQRNGVTWGALPGVRVVGHVTLDPTRKNDPGPQVIDFVRRRYAVG